MKRLLLAALTLCLSAPIAAEIVEQTKGGFKDKFRQIDEHLPTPNVYRTGSGAPGHAYWQQRADYKIKIRLDEKKRELHGKQTITYYNNSPDSLRYIWLQLDQNRFAKHSDAYQAISRSSRSKKKISFPAMREIMGHERGDFGFKLTDVSAKGDALNYTVNDTMMRIDLPKPLKPNSKFTFDVAWWFHVPGGFEMNTRGGFEYFEKDGNDVYFIAQWFPRMAAYTDLTGWEHKQFLGTGEFTLEFGDYDVEITVPDDHIVGSTGELQNPKEVLTAEQRARLKTARDTGKLTMIVNRDEAIANQSSPASGTKTWHFKAENVRDFAFASSRKFVWDAMGVKLPESGRTVMAMSLYPEEAMPLWDKYSTHAIAHTLDTYSRYSFEYPYPTAWSVKGPIGGGMEYPMITSNGPMPTKEEDPSERTYGKRTKYGLISVIIHEIGHIYFPMVLNTDERNWAWMDEGINSFLQSLSEREWEANYPSRYGRPKAAIPYMVSPNQTPIMTQSDSIIGYGPNAYTKPAVALNILRETIMGRELFDFAFAEYSRRWKFKRPYPADFFRTMEDASAKDLDWFWRGWFYTTDHVDIAIADVTHGVISTQDPKVENQIAREKATLDDVYIGEMRNRDADMPLRIKRFPELNDFYNENDDHIITPAQTGKYDKLMKDLKGWEKELLAMGSNLYFIDFENIGGLVMPLVLDVEFTDGSRSTVRVAAEIWRKNHKKATKLLVVDKEIKSIKLDPYNELADADKHNNNWPRLARKSRVELYKRKSRPNLWKEVKDGAKKKTEQ